MPTVYDVILLDPSRTLVSDNSTLNEYSRTELSLLEPLTWTDDSGDTTLSVGDMFNGSTIVALEKTAKQIQHDFGSTTTSRSGFAIETADGAIHFMIPDGADFENIVKLVVVAQPGNQVVSSGFGTQNDAVTIACFAAGTQIETPGGPVDIAALQPGQHVMTLDRGPQPVRWIWRSVGPSLQNHNDPHPVLLKAGSLGPASPRSPLIVSPQNRVLIGDAGQLTHLGSGPALVPAKGLTGLPGIRRMRGKSEVEWHHVALKRHGIVMTHGTWSESLLVAHMLLRAVTRADRDRLRRLYDTTTGSIFNGPPARALLTVRQTQRLVSRSQTRRAA